MDKERILFLDIDGVLTNEISYPCYDIYRLHGYNGIHDVHRFEDLLGVFNQTEHEDLGLFATHESVAEIYSKNVVKMLSGYCKRFNIKIVIISSESTRFINDKIPLNIWCSQYSYWMGLDIIDMIPGTGTLLGRYDQMSKWITKNSPDAEYCLVDDLYLSDDHVKRLSNIVRIDNDESKHGLKTSHLLNISFILNLPIDETLRYILNVCAKGKLDPNFDVEKYINEMTDYLSNEDTKLIKVHP